MKSLSEQKKLTVAIAELEMEQNIKLHSLKEQLDHSYKSFSPLNIIKNTLHGVATSPSIKSNLLSNAIGLGVGYLSKLLLIGNTANPIKNILGTVLQFAITNILSKKSDVQLMASEHLNNPITHNGVSKP